MGIALPGSHRYSVTATFTDASDILVNNEVYMNGSKVGYVGAVSVQQGQAKVQLVIDNPTGLPLYSDALAEIRVQGDRYPAHLAALTGPQDAVKRMVSGLRGKRDQLVRGLNAIEGITCATPAGAFYCFPDVSGILERTGLTCESFAERLLEDAHVAVLAGSAFGPAGTGHLRMCYATDPAQIDVALQRIRAWVGSRTGVAVPR